MVTQPNALAESLEIITYPDPRLRKRVIGTDASIDDVGSLIESMFVTMERSRGMGLAAPQVGIMARVIVVDVMPLDALPDRGNVLMHGRFAMIDPSIVSATGRMSWDEGCLSLPGIKGEVERASEIHVTYRLPDGTQHVLRAGGLLAACIQHEIDHLDGRLFVDRMPAVRRDIELRKLKKFKRRITSELFG